MEDRREITRKQRKKIIEIVKEEGKWKTEEVVGALGCREFHGLRRR